MDKYNMPEKNVIRHFDGSGKLCPAPWRGSAGSTAWPKWNEFKSRLSKLVAGGAVVETPKEESTRYNPKGYPTEKIPAYKTPTSKFLELKVGDAATPRDPLKWFDPENNLFILSPSAKDHVGKTYKVKEVKEVNIGYSKRAYLLDGPLSWVLEQDLVEPRAKFPANTGTTTYTVVKGDYLWKIAQQFNITVEDIKKWNDLDTNLIFTGQKLFVTDPDNNVDRPKEDNGNGEVEPAPTQPEDKGSETPAIELKEGEMLDWLGNIWVRKDK